MPSGIPYIIGNEAAERFSYYGMKAILTVFMTKHLMENGDLAVMSNDDAKAAMHFFSAFNYFTPILGAIAADWFLGKYKTILSLSVVYCLGHLALAIDETRTGLTIGLTLIAIGAGGIKPCVSAHVGDQFGKNASHLFNRVFAWFYFSINVGAFISTIATPILLEKYGPHVAFGIPGLLMLLATIAFWMGRHEFIHVPPKGQKLWTELREPETRRALLRLIPIYLVVSIFWSCFDQTASAWVIQADDMEHRVGELYIGSWRLADTFPALSEWTILDSQMQAVNPILVLLFIPLFTRFIYPTVGRFYTLTSMRRICIGMFLCAASFAITSVIQQKIDENGSGYVHILAQIFPYIVLTMSEILISITGLEFSYTQAPNSLKSIVMAFWFLSVSLGNLVTATVNLIISRSDALSLEGANYYWFFTGLTFVAALVMMGIAFFYQEVMFVQGTEEVAEGTAH